MLETYDLTFRTATVTSEERHLVYGLNTQFDSFCLLPMAKALQIVRELAAITGCRTVGELRAVAEQVSEMWVPGLEELDEEDTPDDESWSWTDAPGVGDGDWPPMPVLYAEELPEELGEALVEKAGAKEISTRLNGDYLRLPPDKEAEMLAVLHSEGFTATRDDDLIQRLSA